MLAEQITLAKMHPVRLRDAVIEQIEERILKGDFQEGQLLPSEQELAAQLGIGRRSVREGLKVLESKGLIEIRTGIGSVVRRNDLNSFLNTLTRNVQSYLVINKADIAHVRELRLILEGQALRNLARDKNPKAIKDLEDDIAEQKAALDAQDAVKYQEWHFRFHQRIVDTLDNPVISMLYRQVLQLMRVPMSRAGAHLDVMARAIGEHQQLVKAAKAGDRDKVQRILDQHLEYFLKDLEAA